MNDLYRKFATASLGLLLCSPSLAAAQDLAGSWTWQTSCKGNYEGAAHKFKLTTNLTIVDGPEDTFTATDGSGTTFIGRALVDQEKPSRFSVNFLTDSINQELDTETHALFLQGAIKDGATNKLKGQSTYVEAYSGTGYAFQCKDKLERSN